MSRRKPELILHIGTGKTGTTSIQTRLASARAELLERGYFYPRSWGHTQFVLVMEPAKAQRLASANPDEKAADPSAAIAKAIGEIPEHVHTVVCVSEMIYGKSTVPGGVARLKTFLDQYFSKVYIIAYLRRQDERAISRYSTLIKAGSTNQGPFEMSEKMLAEYDYATYLEPWAEAFGTDAITVRVFNRAELIEGDAVADFLHVTGVGTLTTSSSGDAERNPSLSAAALEFFRRLNEERFPGSQAAPGDAELASRARGQKSSELRKIMVQHFAGRGHIPQRADAVMFYERFRASNARVIARYMPDRERLFSEDFSRYPEEKNVVTDADVAAIATKVSIALLQELERFSAAENLRRAQDALEQGKTERARKLYLKATEEGSGKVKREAESALRAMVRESSMDVQVALRIDRVVKKPDRARAKSDDAMQVRSGRPGKEARVGNEKRSDRERDASRPPSPRPDKQRKRM